MNKIVAKQFLNALPQELRICVASHNPETAATVPELIESYDSEHSPLQIRVRTRHQDHRPSSRPFSKNSFQQGKQKSERSSRNKPCEKKQLSKIVCYKYNKKGHVVRNCTAKTLHLQKGTERINLFQDGEVNGQPVKRIQLDSGTSRTVVNRSLVSHRLLS